MRAERFSARPSSTDGKAVGIDCQDKACFNPGAEPSVCTFCPQWPPIPSSLGYDGGMEQTTDSGLTTDELLAKRFIIDTGGTEASDGQSWKFHCGGCCYWWDHVNHLSDCDYPLCDRCKIGKDSFDKWVAIHIFSDGD